MFQLDLKSRKSIYEQIVDNVKELIMTGVLSAEEKLPSVRELSKTLTVNPNTIQKAYRELEYQGFLYTIAGLGTFVASREEIIMDNRKVSEIKNILQKNIRELFYLGCSQDKIKSILNELLEERSDWNDKSK
ncbi:MAG: GntR family transcriptional regulator [Eubacteriales bacterium]|nr:GntR family transcriptional regulator [Eubacteriales bacterium]MDD3198916.1 GntR family transcriptional regulator [Eubacteriales bacterium]MDD4629597.1 GntR family transcriptional regulator [Eubacteriales bacterium]